MFSGKDNNDNQENDSAYSGNNFPRKNVALFLIFILLASIIIAGLLFAFRGNILKRDNTDKEKEKINTDVSPTTLGQIKNHLSTEDAVLGKATSTADVKAENLAFGQFYKKEEINVEPKAPIFDLPVNIKSQAVNYYDLGRKINLDKNTDYLNNNGFSIIDNHFKKEEDDFYGIYSLLAKKDVPILITDDFLIYYYQNISKQVFKLIEKGFFYKEFFTINKDFFNIANDRYRKKMVREGIKNDPLLEGERMEAAFFAVGLELLKPEDKQIVGAAEADGFLKEESEKFEYDLPDYLLEQVKKEVQLIREAKQITKSPVMLYERDYGIFKVPNEYSSAKLNNFYLALKWMNSEFPLFYKDDSCPSCLLDKNDWLISFSAASLISDDLRKNQDFKNRWARIYKTIAYFSGLRLDLIYLDYNKSFIKNFGDNYDIDKIFSSESSDREKNILKIRDELATYDFDAIEGGYGERNGKNKPFIGLRMMTDTYWPNNFIFGRLTHPSVGSHEGGNKKVLNKTSCKAKAGSASRCRGFGMDIVNIINPVKNKNKYFTDNTNYRGYEEKAAGLRDELDNFNTNSWHSNNYWSSLNMMKSVFSFNVNYLPFAQKEIWEERNINTAAGLWVNFQLPLPQFKARAFQENFSSGGLKSASKCNPYNYVEPNLGLIKELKAQGRMLLEMFSALKFSEENAYIGNLLKDFDFNISAVDAIAEKELKGEVLSNDDCLFINKIATQYIISESDKKNLNNKSVFIDFSNGEKGAETIDGVKLLIIVNKFGEDKALTVGPVFNYKE